jgi:hypothetical protein
MTKSYTIYSNLSAIFWLPVENTGITEKKPQHVYKSVKFLLAQLAKGNVSFSP